MDFMSSLPRSLRGHDIVWVVVDRLIKSAHFFPIHLSNLAEDLGIIYVHKIVRLHGFRYLYFLIEIHVLHRSFGRGCISS